MSMKFFCNDFFVDNKFSVKEQSTLQFFHIFCQVFEYLRLFFGFVLLDQVCFKNSFFKFGKIQIFNSLGKISYGIYMYHLVVMFVLQKAAIYLIYKLSGQYYLVSFMELTFMNRL